jgi:hypothetical protein
MGANYMDLPAELRIEIINACEEYYCATDSANVNNSAIESKSRQHELQADKRAFDEQEQNRLTWLTTTTAARADICNIRLGPARVLLMFSVIVDSVPLILDWQISGVLLRWTSLCFGQRH